MLARALAKAPAYRYASCGEFADALRQALSLSPYHSSPGAALMDHPATEVAWTVAHADAQQKGPPAATPAEALSPTIGPPAQSARPAGIVSASAVGAGLPRSGTAHGIRQLKRPWKRDWTTWVLILALPVALTGILISPIGSVAAGIGVTLFLLSVLGIPIALIAKLIRRRRNRSHGP